MKARLLCLTCLLVLGGCGGGNEDDNSPPPPPPPPAGTVGAAGGTVSGPGASQVVVPAGALAQNVVITITQSSAGAPALPAGVIAVGGIFEFTPHGTTFASPASVTVPFDPSLVPAGETPTLLKTNAARTGWEEVTGATVSGSTMTGNVSSFSWILPSRIPPPPPPPPPVDVTDPPQRFYRLDGIGLDGAHQRLAGNLEVNIETDLDVPLPPGFFRHTLQVGPLTAPVEEADNFADVDAFSTADGKTYWVFAEAPTGDLLAQSEDQTFLGSRAKLKIEQSYRKNAANATLELRITKASMMLADFHLPGPRLAGCPWSGAPEAVEEDCHDLLSGEVTFEAVVLEGSERTLGPGVTSTNLFDSYRGSAVHFKTSQPDTEFEVFQETLISRNSVHVPAKPPWLKTHFVEVTEGSITEMRLQTARVVPLDISKVPVCEDPNTPERCPEFTVRAIISARAVNRRAGETYAMARLRDPVEIGGSTEGIDGMELVTTGLTATNTPLPESTEITVPAPACTEGTHPDAGVISLSPPAYRMMESGLNTAPILVQRSNGTRGEVVVTVRTRDGTARAGTHYVAQEHTVTFGDGDDTPKAIRVTPMDNNTNDGNVTFELELNAQPGCATLPEPRTIQVTLVDDEARAPPPSPTGTLDVSFGTGGMASSAPFGGQQTRMAVQSDGRIVIVGGSSADFEIARFTADGLLDTSFGTGGQVTTDISGGIVERARAVAIQSDGKIVVAGEGTLASGAGAVALVRYNADGSLDAGFSGDGKVLDTTVRGRAFAVAVQPDGRIVIAGDAPVSGNPNDVADVLIARFNPDGSIDSSFGVGGQRVLDLGVGTDLLRNLVLLTDGDIVAAGDPIGTRTTDRTAVLRLNADGSLDAGFGTGGTLTLAERLGRGLAVQPDGKLLLAGPSSVVAPSQFALRRLNADGTVDSAFGAAGLATTAVSTSTTGVGDVAHAIAVDAEGRIYVAGVAGSLNRNFGIARFTSGGLLDASFANLGRATFDFGGQTDIADSIALLVDGRILLGGSATPASSEGFGLLRLNP